MWLKLEELDSVAARPGYTLESPRELLKILMPRFHSSTEDSGLANWSVVGVQAYLFFANLPK